jgi:hypothetical protein
MQSTDNFFNLSFLSRARDLEYVFFFLSCHKLPGKVRINCINPEGSILRTPDVCFIRRQQKEQEMVKNCEDPKEKKKKT